MSRKKRKQAKERKGWLPSEGVSRHQLYQWAVQAPDFEVWFMDKIFRERRGRAPVTMREDFCGTAILSATWVESAPDRKALGLDLDQETLDWGQEHNLSALRESSRAGDIELRLQDVRTVTDPPADVICAYNFSSFLLHPRAELVAYLKQVRESLAEGGMFFMDCYGGWDAQRPLLERHDIESPGGTFEYTWDQDSFNPIDNLTTCHIHFRFGDGKKIKNAFTYHWRLYGPAELCECLQAAGFSATHVYWDQSEDEDEDDFQLETKAENTPGWLAYVVGEK